MNPIAENIGFLVDMSGAFKTEMTGTLTGDAIYGEPNINLTADCGNVRLICVLRTTRFTTVLPELKKGVRVRLGGSFSPIDFAREGTETFKPLMGLMVVTKLTIDPHDA